MRTRALLFDLDDTLLPESVTYRTAFAAACSVLEPSAAVEAEALWTAVLAAVRPLWRSLSVLDYLQQVQIGSATGLFSAFPGEAPELAFMREWAPTYRRKAWAAAIQHLGLDAATVTVDADAHVACLASSCVIYPDVISALERLKDGYALGVITNGPADVQRAKLRASGLDRFFDTVVVSSEVGYAKPHERAFATALDALGASEQDVIMVGDHLERDVQGARTQGIRAIWLDRSGEGEENGVIRIRSLLELPAVLARLDEAD